MRQRGFGRGERLVHATIGRLIDLGFAIIVVRTLGPEGQGKYALAIAFIIGGTATQLIQSLANNILMPIITFFIPGGAWQEATVTIGPIVISWGKFLGDLIYFIIVALVVFLNGEYLLVLQNLRIGDCCEVISLVDAYACKMIGNDHIFFLIFKNTVD